MAEQVPDYTDVSETSQEFVCVEQEQLVRAAKTEQCAMKVNAKPIPETSAKQQRGILELAQLLPFSWYSGVYVKVADALHRGRQDSELKGTSCDHADIESKMDNKWLRFEVLSNHNNGSVAAMAGPKDVTEYNV